MQQSFADEMTSAPDQDTASPDYAEQWKRAAQAHDDRLRALLGWESFNKLSATAGQQAEAAAKP
ncbi:MAG: hypothetical protein EOP87_21370 [Verrucomicrobiaceae bacterium]|nr:MAG: hypothetical protein EOP87_21370 [Verrucomicrobiaceae bacterium]